jgi:hypothetical protein
MSKSLERMGMLKVFVADSSKLSCQLITAELRRGRYRARVVGFATDAAGIREGLDKVKVDDQEVQFFAIGPDPASVYYADALAQLGDHPSRAGELC